VVESAAAATIKRRYRLDRQLGQGGLCSVYKAYDLELDRHVALKLLHPMLAGKPAAVARLKREILLASRISHPNVVKVYEFGQMHGNTYITLQLVEGIHLRAWLRQHGKAETGQALDFARQLASGLEAVHRAGVIHRDLKPENILIDDEGRLYLTDFGLAAAMEQRGELLTLEDETPGTPLYMSPERKQGLPVDQRTDIYSMGLILRELATGRGPADAGPGELPHPLDAVIGKCLHPKVEERYPTASDLLADLKGRPGKPTKHRPLRTQLVIGFAASILVVAAAFLTWPRSQPAAAAPYAQAEKLETKARTVPDWEAVAGAYAAITQAHPKHVMAHVGAGQAQLQLFALTREEERLAKARTAIHRALDLDPGLAEVRFSLARLRVAEGRHEEAVHLADRLKVDSPDVAEAERIRAQALFRLGRREQAEKAARAAVELDTAQWRHHDTLAWLLAATGRYDEAEKQYREVIALDAGNAGAYHNLGAILIRRGRFQESIDLLEQSLQVQPQAVTYANVGTAYFYMGRYQLASAMFERAMQLQPNSEPYTGFLAETMHWTGNGARAATLLESAIALAETSLKARPGALDTKTRLAFYLWRSGNRAHARKHLESVLQANPRHAYALYTMAVMESGSGRAARAQEFLRQALDAGYPVAQAQADPNWKGNPVPPQMAAQR